MQPQQPFHQPFQLDFPYQQPFPFPPQPIDIEQQIHEAAIKLQAFYSEDPRPLLHEIARIINNLIDMYNWVGERVVEEYWIIEPFLRGLRVGWEQGGGWSGDEEEDEDYDDYDEDDDDGGDDDDEEDGGDDEEEDYNDEEDEEEDYYDDYDDYVEEPLIPAPVFQRLPPFPFIPPALASTTSSTLDSTDSVSNRDSTEIRFPTFSERMRMGVRRSRDEDNDDDEHSSVPAKRSRRAALCATAATLQPSTPFILELIPPRSSTTGNTQSVAPVDTPADGSATEYGDSTTTTTEESTTAE